MKKIISTILIFTILFSTNIAIADYSNEESTLKNKIYITQNSKGQTIISNKNDGIEADLIMDGGIYSDIYGNYYSLTGTKSLQQVQLIKFNLFDTNFINNELSKYAIPHEIFNDIEIASEEAIENNKDTEITLVAPYQPLTRGSYYHDYTYNGTPMRDYFVYAFNKDTSFKEIDSGASTKETASLLSSFAITGAGLTTVALSYLAAGVSIFQAMNEYVQDTNFSGRSSDYLQIAIIYDVSTKYTYADQGNGWDIGLVSENVYITEVSTRQYYADCTYNRTVKTTYHPNKSITSPHFSNSAPTALQHIGNPLNEELTSHFGHYTLHY